MPQQLSRSLAACALAMELHGPGSAAATAESDRCRRLIRRLPLEQQCLTPQGLEALCRMLMCDTDRGLLVLQTVEIMKTQGWPPAAAQMRADEQLRRWA